MAKQAKENPPRHYDIDPIDSRCQAEGKICTKYAVALRQVFCYWQLGTSWYQCPDGGPHIEGQKHG